MQGPKPGHAFSGTPKSSGLGCASSPAGTKSYILNYRVAGRERRATLARASDLSLKAARTRAAEELAVIRAGEADPLERRREARHAPTVADGLERFFSDFAPARIEIGRMTARTVKDYRQQALHARATRLARAQDDRDGGPICSRHRQPGAGRSRTRRRSDGRYDAGQDWRDRGNPAKRVIAWTGKNFTDKCRCVAPIGAPYEIVVRRGGRPARTGPSSCTRHSARRTC